MTTLLRSWLSFSLAALAAAQTGCRGGAPADPPEEAPRQTTFTPRSSARVFFVGHSLVNLEMPRNMSKIAESLGLDLEWDAQIIDGAPLEIQVEESVRGRPMRWDEALPSGFYDTLVMTEAVPIDDMIRYRTPARFAAIIAAEARRGDPRARVFLYESWMRRDLARGLPLMKKRDWRAFLDEDLSKWESIADEAAERAGADFAVLPAARALGLLADAVGEGEVPGVARMDDLFVDEVHLAPIGNHFVAAVTLAAVFQRSPRGASGVVVDRHGQRVARLPKRTRDALYSIAWAAISGYPRAATPPADRPRDRRIAEGEP